MMMQKGNSEISKVLNSKEGRQKSSKVDVDISQAGVM